MSKEWREVRLEEVAQVKSGKRLPKGHSLTTKNTSLPYIRLVDIKNGLIQRKSLFYLEKETQKKISKYIVNAGDVCLAIVGHTIGMVFIVSTQFENTNLTENAARITGFSNEIHNKFLYYYLTSPKGQREIQSRKIGSAQGKLPLYNIKSFPVKLPPLPEQKAIAHILGNLDDKIELNRQTNATLEAMAQALFRSWFVDFDPVLDNALRAGNPIPEALQAKAATRQQILTQANAPRLPQAVLDLFPASFVFNEALNQWVPEGWQIQEIGTLANVIDPHPSHRAPKVVEGGFPFAGIGDIAPSGDIRLDKAREIGEEFVIKQEKDYVINHQSIGYGRVGTVGKVVRLRKQKYRFALSPTLAVINTKDESYGEYIFYAVSDKSFFNNVLQNMTGTTRPAIGIQVLRRIGLVVPNDNKFALIKYFSSIVRSGYKKVDKLNIETQTLTQLRDTLLPQLISGRVRVPEGLG